MLEDICLVLTMMVRVYGTKIFEVVSLVSVQSATISATNVVYAILSLFYIILA